MADVKDEAAEAAKEIFKYKPMKYLIVIFLSLAIGVTIFSFFHHVYRCNKGLNSTLFWGMDGCQECKIIDSTRYDTIRYTKTDTFRITHYVYVGRSRSGTDKKGDTAIKPSTFALQNPTFNAPAQVGDNNTQNNQLSPKPREATDSLIDAIEIKVNFNKNSPISVYRRSTDNESNEFATKIVLALQKAGFKNAFVNGIMSDPIIGGDPSENARLQRQIKMQWNGGQFDITIPSQ